MEIIAKLEREIPIYQERKAHISLDNLFSPKENQELKFHKGERVQLKGRKRERREKFYPPTLSSIYKQERLATGGRV